jgi:hypothetical protein
MVLTLEEKAERARRRMIEKAREYSTGTYANRFVSPIFQRMIRAEAAAMPTGKTPAIVDGEWSCAQLAHVFRKVGQCVCVTCGKVLPWSGGVARYSGMHTGHFLASRRNSILFDEDNVAPQCSHCNYHEHGAQQRFTMWMVAVRGEEAVQRLRELKNAVLQFSREDLVDMRIEYKARLKAAEERMRGG